MMDTRQEFKTTVSDKPYPVSIEMRPLWRISLIIICIKIVSKEENYLDSKKVNVLVWMLIRKTRWPEYEDYLLGRTNTAPLVSVDTATFKAVEFSIAKELIYIENGRLYITEKGIALFNILLKNEIMEDEVIFLETAGKKLTDKKVAGLTGGTP